MDGAEINHKREETCRIGGTAKTKFFVSLRSVSGNSSSFVRTEGRTPNASYGMYAHEPVQDVRRFSHHIPPTITQILSRGGQMDSQFYQQLETEHTVERRFLHFFHSTPFVFVLRSINADCIDTE